MNEEGEKGRKGGLWGVGKERSVKIVERSMIN